MRMVFCCCFCGQGIEVFSGAVLNVGKITCKKDMKRPNLSSQELYCHEECLKKKLFDPDWLNIKHEVCNKAMQKAGLCCCFCGDEINDFPRYVLAFGKMDCEKDVGTSKHLSQELYCHEDCLEKSLFDPMWLYLKYI